MKSEFIPERLDVAVFAGAAVTLSASDSLSRYQRLAAEANAPHGDCMVNWQAVGAQRTAPGGSAIPWMHLQAQVGLPLVCQRCLGPVEVALRVDRWFRFAADEATAAAQDEESEEDVLVATRDFDLRALVEDELLMELPVVPRHEVCPEPVRLSAADVDFEQAEAQRPNPFDMLEKLRTHKPE